MICISSTKYAGEGTDVVRCRRECVGRCQRRCTSRDSRKWRAHKRRSRSRPCRSRSFRRHLPMRRSLHSTIARGLVVAIGLVFAVGCSTAKASCDTVVEYRLGAAVADSGTHGFGVNVSGHIESCEVRFVSFATTARYLVAPPSGTPEAAPPGPHKADSDVCHLFSLADVALITVVAGPTPSTAWRSGDCLEVVLGSEMLAYLKSNIYEVTVTCGVDVLIHSQGLDANNQRCAL